LKFHGGVGATVSKGRGTTPINRWDHPTNDRTGRVADKFGDLPAVAFCSFSSIQSM